jgi:hypothetical protein
LKRKLWLLNTILLACIAVGGYRLREQWRAARSREQAFLSQRASAGPAVSTSIPAPPAVTAANYLDVAQKMLFSRDRNPNVEIEPPPPPKPMPPLPKAHGVMLLSDPPTAILSEKSGAAQKSYRPGDKIGQFKVVEVTTTEIEFEWEGKRVRRALEELADKGPPVQAAAAVEPGAAAPASPAPAGPTANVIGSNSSDSQAGPNNSSQPRPCDPSDSSPEGTVQNGMKKVFSNTPFGRICRWDPVK